MTQQGEMVSVIVTTKNNCKTLGACLQSIAAQTYIPFEIIVVDNESTDETVEIAKSFTKHVYSKAPERSAQRNFGVEKAVGKYVLIVDSDMELETEVVVQCVASMQKNPLQKAMIIPEMSFGKGFWAQVKRLERSFYIGQDAIEAARFFERDTYLQLGGYSEAMTGGEDWDLTRRFRENDRIGRCKAYVHHNEGHPRFMRTVKKMYYYGQHASQYFESNKQESAVTSQSGPLARYKLFLSQPLKLFRNPLIGLGVLTLKTAEYTAVTIGILNGTRKNV